MSRTQYLTFRGSDARGDRRGTRHFQDDAYCTGMRRGRVEDNWLSSDAGWGKALKFLSLSFLICNVQ